MKTEFADVNETRKNVRVEIPSDVVSAEIDRIARAYSRKVRVPGFRPGKAPARVIKQRYKEQILHDVAQDLIPRAVDDALRERGMEAVDTPDIRDVHLHAGEADCLCSDRALGDGGDPLQVQNVDAKEKAGRNQQ